MRSDNLLHTRNKSKFSKILKLMLMFYILGNCSLFAALYKTTASHLTLNTKAVNINQMFTDGEPWSLINSEERYFQPGSPIKFTKVDSHHLRIQNFVPADIDNVLITARFNDYPDVMVVLFKIPRLKAHTDFTIEYPFVNGATTDYLDLDGNSVDLSGYTEGVAPENITLGFDGTGTLIENLKACSNSTFTLQYTTSLDNGSKGGPLLNAIQARLVSAMYINAARIWSSTQLFERSDEELYFKLVDGVYTKYTNEHVADKLRKCRTRKAIKAGMTYKSVGMGGKGCIWLNRSNNRKIYTDTTFSHESGHLMGFSHSTNLTYAKTYGGEDKAAYESRKYGLTEVWNDVRDDLLADNLFPVTAENYYKSDDLTFDPVYPTIYGSSSHTIDENSPIGYEVGSVTAYSNNNSDPMTFSVTSSSPFSIDSDGTITVKEALDYVTAENHQYSVTVRATDSLGFWITKIVTVSLTDNPVERPVVTSESFEIDEDIESGGEIGILSAVVDSTRTDKSVSFEIVSGNGGGVFALDSDTGSLTLVSTPPLSGAVLGVRATDSEGLQSVIAKITINVIPSPVTFLASVAGGSLHVVANWDKKRLPTEYNAGGIVGYDATVKSVISGFDIRLTAGTISRLENLVYEWRNGTDIVIEGGTWDYTANSSSGNTNRVLRMRENSSLTMRGGEFRMWSNKDIDMYNDSHIMVMGGVLKAGRIVSNGSHNGGALLTIAPGRGRVELFSGLSLNNDSQSFIEFVSGSNGTLKVAGYTVSDYVNLWNSGRIRLNGETPGPFEEFFQVQGSALSLNTYVATPTVGMKSACVDGVISWTVQNEVDVKEYHIVDSLTGEVLEVFEAGKSSYSYDLVGDKEVLITVVDHNGNTQSHNPMAADNVIIELESGWNLISVPFTVTNLEKLGKRVWLWDAKSGCYMRARRARQQQGLWLYSESERKVSLTGTVKDKPLELSVGWSLVGPTENFEKSTGLLIYGWDAAYQATQVLSAGKGYWIYSDTSQAISLP